MSLMGGLKLAADEDLPLDNHLSEFSYRASLLLLLVAILTVVWSFQIDSILTYTMRVLDPCLDSCMNVFEPAEWTALRWLSSALLAMISVGPLAIQQIYSFSARGLMPAERRWLLSWLASTWLLACGSIYFTMNYLMPKFFAMGHSVQADVGLIGRYDAAETLGLSLALAWSELMVLIAISALIIAGKTNMVHRENADGWRLRIHGTMVMLLWLVMPDSTPGAWIGIAIIAVTLVEFFAHGPLNQSMPTPFRLKEILDTEGGLRRILMADCACEAACPKNYIPENIGIFSADGLCSRASERDSLLQVIAHSKITDLIITGCDSSPLPDSFKQSLQSLQCDLRGLDLMRIANSRTIKQEPIGLDADLAKASMIDPWSKEVVQNKCQEIFMTHNEVEFLISSKPPPFGLQMQPDQAWLQIEFAAEFADFLDTQAVRYRLI
jgi:Sec-independent protein secretion pathway component TatC